MHCIGRKILHIAIAASSRSCDFLEDVKNIGKVLEARKLVFGSEFKFYPLGLQIGDSFFLFIYGSFLEDLLFCEYQNIKLSI